MARKPKPKSESTAPPEQFELPNMPEKDTKKMTNVEIAMEKRRRDQYGLLPNLEYKFTDDGFVDWESMIPSKFYYANKDFFGPEVDVNSIDVSELPPEKKIINLDGIKWLLQARGAESVEFVIGSAYPDYAAVTCNISWTPNFEQNFKPLSTSGAGEAHAFNNKAPFKYLVATLAENKALSRAVRLACRIKSYSTDELRGEPIEKEEDSNQNLGSQPQDALKKAANDSSLVKEEAKKRGMTIFEMVRWSYIQKLQNEEEKEKASKWNDFSDVPREICFVLTGRIKTADKVEKEK